MTIEPTFTQFTVEPNHYPLNQKGCCGIDTMAPHQLTYTFSDQKTATVFWDHLSKWTASGQLPKWGISSSIERPFEKANPPFSACPEIRVYKVSLTIPSDATEIASYHFSQAVGSLEKLERMNNNLQPPSLLRSSSAK